jgi:hypothetical protein
MPSLRQIAPPRLRNLTHRLGWAAGQPKDQVEPGDAMYLWVAQFIGMTTALSGDQIDLILNTFSEAIRQYGTKFADEFDRNCDKLTIAHLMIADGRFASISGSTIFLDVASGDVLPVISRAPALVLNYNMGEVYMRAIASLNRQKDGDGQETEDARRNSHISR